MQLDIYIVETNETNNQENCEKRNKACLQDALVCF
jgi:hypothetical protein